MFAGRIKKRSDGPCSKTIWAVRGPVTLGTTWTTTFSRAHEDFATSAPTISAAVDKTNARRNPSRCKMRSKRSSKLTPHNSNNAWESSAIKIGRVFSTVREITGGGTRCQLSPTFQASPRFAIIE